MLALMMERPLTLPSILEYAALYHPDREVVARTVEGPIHRYGYARALARTKRMANALTALGVSRLDAAIAARTLGSVLKVHEDHELVHGLPLSALIPAP